MLLLAASYENIGPFKDQIILLDIQAGSHLIQAPIGSGKSFLFFDGPLFGLYKHRQRPMLNKSSDAGTIQVLFQIEEQLRLIQRSISPTSKGGESIRTKLWEVSGEDHIKRHHGETSSDILTRYGSHLSSCILKQELQEIEFTNSKEADQSIQDLLPPKELVMSTNILMQEASNVFELAPAERINVFKHLFGLIGIDEAKEHISQRRKELQTMIHIKSDQSHHTKKLQETLMSLQQSLTGVQGNISDIGTLHPEASIVSTRETQTDTGFFSDMHLIGSDAHIKDFYFTGDDRSRIMQMKVNLEERHTVLTKAQGKEEERQKQALEKEKQIQQLQARLPTLEKKKHQLAKDIHARQKEGNTTLLEAQKTIDLRMQELESKIPFEAFEAYGEPLTSSAALEVTLQKILHAGTTLSQELKTVETSRLHHETTLKEGKNRLISLQEQKLQLETSHKNQAFFECDKIQGACPYVNLINKNAVGALKKQIDQLSEQETALKQKEKATILQQEEISEKHAQLSTTLQATREFLTKIKWKELEKIYQEVDELQTKKSKHEEQLHLLQKEQDETRGWEKELAIAETEMLGIQEQIKDIQDHTTLKESEDNLPIKEESIGPLLEFYTSTKRHLEAMIKECTTLERISHEHASHKKEVKQLQESLEMTKELHHIFSKELMIVVLQDFLPALQEILNSYLAQIVGYEVRFLQPENEGDQLELDIEIHDEKGSRSVKSLSGGQRTILKLVWMLSVSTLFRSSFLLLDETINNLDTATISQVADVLQEFITSQDITFYVVTHSPQIQQMDIRDSVIKLL